MGTMNISWPDALRDLVDAQVNRGGYGTTSESVRELIRRDQERLRLRAMLLEGAESPPSGDADSSYSKRCATAAPLQARQAPSVSRRTPIPLVRRARADADVTDAIDYYLAESPAAALGFMDALEAAYEHIRRAPGHRFAALRARTEPVGASLLAL